MTTTSQASAVAGATPIPAPVPANIQKTLKKVFGLKRLRPGQWDVVQRVLQGASTLAVMPTGAGKSLCYQLPAVLLPGITVVVSPLVALMKDQCDTLRGLGVAAVQVNSAISAEELSAARAAIDDGSARIVLTTPEQMADPSLTAALARHTVSLLVVDEAHCISQWGHDFRPAFLEIAPAVRALGRPAVLALTATAKPAVMKEIVAQFGIASGNIVQAGAYRPNLQLAVEQLSRSADRLPRALQYIAATEGTGVVYASTVKSAQELYDKLAAAGESVALYHGKLPAARRAEAQDAFMDGKVRVMVATNAFGLGIDKPDIRFVLHYQMPASVDTYYQEAGRAGRDGNDSQCTLLYVRQDRSLQQFFMSGRYPTLDDLQAVHTLLHQAAPEGGWTADAIVDAVARPRAKTLVGLSLLRSHKVVRRDRSGRFGVARELSGDALEKLLCGYRRRREQDGETLEAMVAYAQGGRCRWHAVLSALGEEPPFDGCGRCDNCRRMAALKHLAPAVAMPERPIEVRPPVTAKPSFTSGQAVRARRYGAGQVVEANSHAVTVEFANGTRRTFLPEFVRAARSSAPLQQQLVAA
ncbi:MULTISPECIES: RecQ family ATP-dependent DNA helicase [unclassified Acidovorax]|uniref:RecQ family ATP-dependent DNA helicase n=1 Tax=unclassified Acidovorax TaxID=2684926 RepID=UPI0009E8A7FB|nr:MULTISPECIES: RecQ family ATP-dependent DNA helicase [unclassified Acidovorax]